MTIDSVRASGVRCAIIALFGLWFDSQGQLSGQSIGQVISGSPTILGN